MIEVTREQAHGQQAKHDTTTHNTISYESYTTSTSPKHLNTTHDN
jgi:hypothetical protein